MPDMTFGDKTVSAKALSAVAYVARLWMLFIECLFYIFVEPFRNPKVIRRHATSGMMSISPA